MTEPHSVGDDLMSPARIFDEQSFQSDGAGMAGTAVDFMTFLEAIRRGGSPILHRDTVAVATANQVYNLRHAESPGQGFGYLFGIITDPHAADLPANPGTLFWGGVWGLTWFMDPEAARAP